MNRPQCIQCIQCAFGGQGIPQTSRPEKGLVLKCSNNPFSCKLENVRVFIFEK